MYCEHFGLNELPFGLTPNTAFYCSLPPHQEAMQVLLTALQAGEGVLKIVGEVGTGKTLLCRKLLNELASTVQVVYLPNPFLNPQEMRWAIAHELGLDIAEQQNQQQLIHYIQLRLIQLVEEGKQIVVIVDEAQAIPDESLEALRLITNLETEKRKLLQLVLFGQPELDKRLAADHLRQLRQRISFSYQLRPLLCEELPIYIQHRMVAAGHRGVPIFSDAVCRAVYAASRGTPRIINQLCHKILMLCYGRGCHQANMKQLKAAVMDTDDAQWRWWYRIGWLCGGVR